MTFLATWGCAGDTNIQNGRQSSTPKTFVGEFHIELEENDKPFFSLHLEPSNIRIGIKSNRRIGIKSNRPVKTEQICEKGAIPVSNTT